MIGFLAGVGVAVAWSRGQYDQEARRVQLGAINNPNSDPTGVAARVLLVERDYQNRRLAMFGVQAACVAGAALYVWKGGDRSSTVSGAAGGIAAIVAAGCAWRLLRALEQPMFDD